MNKHHSYETMKNFKEKIEDSNGRVVYYPGTTQPKRHGIKKDGTPKKIRSDNEKYN